MKDRKERDPWENKTGVKVPCKDLDLFPSNKTT